MKRAALHIIIGLAGGVIGLLAGVWGASLMFVPMEVNQLIMRCLAVLVFVLMAVWAGVNITQKSWFERSLALLLLVLGVFMGAVLWSIAPVLPGSDGLPEGDLLAMLADIPELISYLLPAILVGVVLVVLSAMAMVWKHVFGRMRLMKEGLDAKGRILSVASRGLRMNGMDMLELELEVHVDAHTPYVVKDTFAVPGIMLSSVKVGEEILLKVDPDDPKCVTLGGWKYR